MEAQAQRTTAGKLASALSALQAAVSLDRIVSPYLTLRQPASATVRAHRVSTEQPGSAIAAVLRENGSHAPARGAEHGGMR